MAISKWYRSETLRHSRLLATPMRPVSNPVNQLAKCADYAQWLMYRDSPSPVPVGKAQYHITFDVCDAGERPRFVEFCDNDKSLAVVELPNWNFVEREPIYEESAEQLALNV